MTKKGVIFAITRDNKILMQLRDDNSKEYPFMWCIPGGGCESGESYEETLLREVKEEYDIDLGKDQYEFLMNYYNDGYKVYICRIRNNQEPVLKEGLDMKWMTLEEIEKIELGFEQAGIVRALKGKLS